jgi:hypothetical protein
MGLRLFPTIPHFPSHLSFPPVATSRATVPARIILTKFKSPDSARAIIGNIAAAVHRLNAVPAVPLKPSFPDCLPGPGFDLFAPWAESGIDSCRETWDDTGVRFPSPADIIVKLTPNRFPSIIPPMKHEAKFFPRLVQVQKSVVHRFTYFLVLIALLAAGPISTARAADDNPIVTIKKLSKEGLTAPEYAAAVADLVKQNPKDSESLIAEAVKDIAQEVKADVAPVYVCAIVQAGIAAVTPVNGSPDPKEVAAIVATVVQNLQSSNPELVQQIVSCALDVAKDAGPAIQQALAGLFTGPNGLNHPASQNGGALPPGVGGNPALQPTPTPQPQMTQVVPI